MSYALARQGATLGAIPRPPEGDGDEMTRAQRAVDYIHAWYGRYMDWGPQILAMQAAAGQIAGDAARAGQDARRQAADELVRALAVLYRQWDFVRGQVQWVAQRVPGFLSGWVVPVLVSAVAVAAAAGIWLIDTRARQADAVLGMLEAGVLTVEEARSLGLEIAGAPLFRIGAGAGLAVVVGVAGWALWRGRGG